MKIAYFSFTLCEQLLWNSSYILSQSLLDSVVFLFTMSPQRIHDIFYKMHSSILIVLCYLAGWHFSSKNYVSQSFYVASGKKEDILWIGSLNFSQSIRKPCVCSQFVGYMKTTRKQMYSREELVKKDKWLVSGYNVCVIHIILQLSVCCASCRQNVQVPEWKWGNPPTLINISWLNRFKQCDASISRRLLLFRFSCMNTTIE